VSGVLKLAQGVLDLIQKKAASMCGRGQEGETQGVRVPR